MDEDLEETSQLWVLRHLRLVLGDVDDRLLTRFVFEEDCTPLRNFASQFTDSPALFLVVHRRAEPPQKPPEKEKEEKPRPKKKREPKTKDPVKKTMKPQPKRKPKKPEGEEPKKEKPRKDMPDVVAEELKLMETHPVAEEAELRMEWRLGTLPRTKEFLFFVTRDHPKESERSEFDQAFHVGHCAAGTRLGALIDNARFLLGERISGARELQIFYHFAGVTNCGGAERGINDFEDFIYECIGKTFAPQKRVSMTVVGQVATIEEILKPRIEEFIKSADEDTRSRLLLELSFFEVGRFAEDEDLASLCGRLSRVRDALEVYASFFFESNEEFFRKLHAYVVEQCFKVLAENIKRKCDYLEADFFEEVEGSLASKEISRKIVPCVARILELEGHEFVLLARTRQNFRLLEVLEGDLEV
uniref:PARP n=1 Tax=Steinernema glaseri TaxID=37863 RepID=A0A1I7YE61_9BILA